MIRSLFDIVATFLLIFKIKEIISNLKSSQANCLPLVITDALVLRRILIQNILGPLLQRETTATLAGTNGIGKW